MFEQRRKGKEDNPGPIYIICKLYMYMCIRKNLSMQGDIKMQRPHPKQGHKRMLYDQPETRMAEMVCPGRADEELGEGMQKRR